MASIDATPGDSGGQFGVEFLRTKGFFQNSTRLTDAYGPDSEITYVCTDRIAYFEGVDIEAVSDVVTGLKRRRNFDFYWFWEPDRERVEVLRSFGENKQFIYNPAVHTGETRKGKRRKLERIDTDGLTRLFDVKDVTDKFYTDLWDHRLHLAEEIKAEAPVELSDQTALLTAQRTIDRLIFTYFLADKGVIVGVAPNGHVSEIDAQELFARVIEEIADFGSFVQTLFHDRLNNKRQNNLAVSDGFSLYVPYLNGGLFRDRTLDSADGTESVREKELELSTVDWAEIVQELNDYNWLLEDYEVESGIEKDVRGTLTPEVLGSIYERFVITVSEVDDLTLENLRQTFQGDVKQMQRGNRDIGAYYTPEDVVEHIISYCLWEYLNEQVPETRKFDSFTDFHTAKRAEDEGVFEAVEAALASVTVCDPGVGSGHFLLALADKLEDWRLKTGYEGTTYDLRKEIVLENLYGVDVLEGATDICQLRMWLWLVGGQEMETLDDAVELSDFDAEAQLVEPLPHIDYNVRSGNSLLGFTTDEVVVDGTKILVTQGLQSDIEEYETKVDEIKQSQSDVEELEREIESLRASVLPKINRRYARYLNSYFVQGEDRNRQLHFEDGEDFARKTERINGSSYFVKIRSRDSLDDELLEFLDSPYSKTAKNTISETEVGELASLIDEEETDRFEESYVECEVSAAEFGVDGSFDPVHWIFEFPDVFTGPEPGFDVVVGNPPYGEDVLGKNETELLSNFSSSDCGDVAGFFLEREIELLRENGVVGNVIAASILVNRQMTPVRDYLRETVDGANVSFFGIRPAKIFDTVDERVSFVLGRKDTENPDGIYTSRNIRFTAEQRATLFDSIQYGYADDLLIGSRLGLREDGEKERPPKVGRPETRKVLLQLKDTVENGRDLGDAVADSGTHRVAYRASGRYWLQSLESFPSPAAGSSKIIPLSFDTEVERDFAKLAINSSLFYLFWSAYGNNRDLQKTMIERFPVPSEDELDRYEKDISRLSAAVESDLKSCYDPDAGTVGEFDPSQIRDTIDSIDRLLGDVYQLDQELVTYVEEYDSHLRS